MDPPLIHEASFSAANPSSYSLTEIWPVNNGGGGNEGLGVKGGRFRGFGHGGGDDESSVTDECLKIVSTSCHVNGLKNMSGKRMKVSGSKDESGGSKDDDEKAAAGEESSKPAEPVKDYIHVRARRGQATDSHSLAERARREKISERMKLLQDLVPGCNKVIGKAVVLDEIINYIQSLQHQVEFLSMKLEAVNSRMNSPIEGFPTKELGPQQFDAAGLMFGSQAGREFGQESQPEWLHMQLGSSFERTT